MEGKCSLFEDVDQEKDAVYGPSRAYFTNGVEEEVEVLVSPPCLKV